MLTLIHKPQTRSASIVWLLEEIGAPYEKKIVTLRSQDGTGERDPSNPHPHGKVPALVHDGHTIFETSAIALYLTDLFPDAKMGPKVGDANRGEYLSWLAYRSGVLEPAFMERRFGITELRPGQYVLVRYGTGPKGLMVAEIRPDGWGDAPSSH